MVHLTNDYRKLLRRNGPKAALSLCVALALSGGLVSAEGKTYDYVNQWGREALEGDPIEVVHMGSGDGNVQAGKDVTNKVIVHSLGTYKDANTKETPHASVKGRMIEILGDLGNSGGGKVSIGGDTTDSVDIKGILNNNSNSDTVVNGTEITSGYTGNWGGSLLIGNDKTKSVIMDGFGSSNKAESLIQGGTISTGSLGVWGADASFKADREFKVAKDGNFQTMGLTDGGTISVTAGSMEAGGLGVSGNYGNESKAEFHIGGASGIHFHDGLSANTNGNILIDSQKIQVDGHSGDGSSIHTTDSTISMGNDESQITLNGQLCNAGSKVTLNGKSIFINAAKPDSTDGSYNYAVETTNGNISSTVIGNKNTNAVHINGKTNVSSIGSSLKIEGRHIEMAYGKGVALSGYGGHIYVGGSNTENLTIAGQVSNQSSEYLNLSGEHITVDSTGYDGSESTQFPFSESLVTLQNSIDAGDKRTKTIFISSGLSAQNGNINVMGKEIAIGASSYFNTHEIKNWNGPLTDGYIARAANGNVNIGSEDTNTVKLHDGQLLTAGKDISVAGRSISISGNNDWAGWTNHGTLRIGTDDSDSVQIQGGIHAQGGGAVIQGKQISISSNDESRYALDGIGGDITVGSDATQSINVDGGIDAEYDTISLTGHNISVSKAKGKDYAVYVNQGTVKINTNGSEEAHITGPIKNSYGIIQVSLNGKSSQLDSTLDDGSRGVNVYDKAGKFVRTNGFWLSLNNQASWNPLEDSIIYSYKGNDGIIHLDNNTHQTVTVSAFKDADTRIHEDIYGSGNTGNDTIHIDKSYTGHTHFWLVNRDDTDKGVEGTVLASVKKKGTNSAEKSGGAVALMAVMPSAASDNDPIADFQADHFKAFGMNSLYFKTYGLGVKDSEGETADYTKDLIITGVTNHTTNDKGQYTPTVSTALSGSSLMYYTWRTENDKMLQRVGDLRENEGEETGLWARIRGSRIGKNHSDRGFKNQYKVYEIGYDAKTEDNDRMKSFTGIAFSYLDGKGYYTDGRGTNQATSAAIYHTDIHKTGHYLDLVFRIRHMNERLHTHTTVDTDIGPVTEDHSASLDTTGLSFSAEYGRKKFMGKGWYVEPQTQWTLGYLGPVQYEMDNGTRVEQPGITSFVGRAGFNLGRQVNENSIVYLKANVYHEFGGHSPLHLYAGDESLSFTDTFDDTWFEYGVGFAVKLGNGLSLYGDVEKTAGSHFYKDWQWNAGLRYSF